MAYAAADAAVIMCLLPSTVAWLPSPLELIEAAGSTADL